MNIPDNYQLTDNEFDNLIYILCKYTINWPMRQADKIIIKTMINNQLTGSQLIHNIIETTCEYLWDHMLGEPQNPTAQDLINHIKEPIEHWYNTTTQEQRTKI